MTNFDDEIRKHEEAIENLQKQKEAMKDKEFFELAEKLHNEFCKLGHEDRCGWYFEIKNDVHNWGGYTHAEWLEKAKKVNVILDKYNLTFEQFVEIKKVI